MCWAMWGWAPQSGAVSLTAAQLVCTHSCPQAGFLMSLSSVGDELTPPDLSVLDPKDLHSNAALLLTLAVLVSLSSVSFECLFQFPKLGTTASWLCSLSSQPDLLWLAQL